MNNINLKDYICIVPFVSLEIFEKERTLCCASWLKKQLPRTGSVKEAWTSNEANEIRNSVIDGSFKYCSKELCPYLNQLIQIGDIQTESVIKKKENLTSDLKKRLDAFKQNKILFPTTVHFSFDRTCNLRCPSCRINVIVENNSGIKRVNSTVEEIEKDFGKTTKTIYITGSGDPFVSVAFKNFLKNFNSLKWPNLEKIHLHTNATKWNQKMWNSMQKIHRYVKTCEISIDAATKETYENKVRIGGKWDELMQNLNFISKIKTLKLVKVSFVVQSKNYKEMETFYNLMLSIFKSKANIFFGKINNWGTYTDEEFKEIKIWDKNHPNYNEFINEINRFLPAKQCWHNFHELIKPKKLFI